MIPDVPINKNMTPKWIAALSLILRNKVVHRPYLQKALINTAWLFGDKILRMGVGLIVGIWIARYLGPEQFGLLNYALAFVALFTSVANFGLNGIVVRDLVQDPSMAETTLGSAFFLLVIGGFSAFALSLLFISHARPNDALTKFIVMLLSIQLILKATDVVRYWFESQIQSKYIVWMENGLFLIFSAVKIVLILIHASLIFFVWIILAETLIVAIMLPFVYTWQGGILSAWHYQLNRMKTLLNESWPLILSGLAIMIYMRIDQIMIGQILGDKSVGIYSAAVRVSEIWYFIPISIVASVYPSLIEAKKSNDSLYYQRLQKLYDIMVLLSLVVAISMTFFSNWIINFLFGYAYYQAGAILTVHIWAGIFVFLGIASEKWLLIEGLQRYSLYRTMLGAIVNFGLNLFMIPKYGAIGAAYATVISFAIAAILFDLLKEKTRSMLKMKLKAFNIFRIATSFRR